MWEREFSQITFLCNLEKQLGKLVISKENALNYKYLEDTKKLKDNNKKK